MCGSRPVHAGDNTRAIKTITKAGRHRFIMASLRFREGQAFQPDGMSILLLTWGRLVSLTHALAQ